jgi:LPS-assembly lipoprotein
LSLDRFASPSRRTLLMAALAVSTLLAGCQVRPLYSQADGSGRKLANLGFSEPKNRVEQAVRNELVFLAAGGAGEPLNPAYDLTLNVSSTASNVLDDDGLAEAGVPVPGRVEVTAAYTLTRTSDSRVLKQSQRTVVSLIDVSRQTFAKLRAIRDAENRAAREAAEFIRNDVAIALSREPQQPEIWQK